MEKKLTMKEKLELLYTNIDWIESMNPCSIMLDCVTPGLNIHVDSKSDVTKEFFKNNISEIRIQVYETTEYCNYERYCCEVIKDVYRVCAFFKSEELKELGIEPHQ